MALLRVPVPVDDPFGRFRAHSDIADVADGTPSNAEESETSVCLVRLGDVTSSTEPEQIPFETAADLRLWLAMHHHRSDSVLLLFPDRDTGAFRDQLLIYGWVDTDTFEYNGSRAMVVTRRLQHRWTESAQHRAQELLATGLLQPAGIAAIQYGKSAGTWAS
jgi:hypothetical protein